MLRPPVTISIAFVKGMLSGVHAHDIPCDEFLEDAGIAPGLLEQPGARVTAGQYALLFQSLIDRLDDECMGFLSRPIKRGSMAMMSRSAISAATLEVAIRRMAHTFRLLQDEFVLESVREGPLAGLAMRPLGPRTEFPVFFHELLLRIFWRLLAWLVGGKLPVARFDFAFASPPHAGSYDRIFPGPLRFSSDQSAFWFDAGNLKDAVRRNEASLGIFLKDATTHILLPKRSADSIAARVRAHLEHAQPQWPDLMATAQTLHMAASTLQRRLTHEATTFQAIKDELRRDIAITQLNTGTMGTEALARQLGFVDGTSFQRAFKGWTGSPPGAYRRGEV